MKNSQPHIVKAESDETERLALIVSQSNQDIADLFGLNKINAPKHPSFCTPAWIKADVERGATYFLYIENGTAKGCVAFEQPDRDTAYLNRLSVLPEFRHKGIGSLMVRHIIDYAANKNVKTISIGIIAEHNLLKEWYLKLGFEAGAVKTFSHLPFAVCYMSYDTHTQN
jgi:GNAT superfamily N-acetyltransferase